MVGATRPSVPLLPNQEARYSVEASDEGVTMCNSNYTNEKTKQNKKWNINKNWYVGTHEQPCGSKTWVLAYQPHDLQTRRNSWIAMLF